MKRKIYLLLLFAVTLAAVPICGEEFFCDEGESNLMRDLMIVDYWNCRNSERIPVHYNHLMQGGYFSMPSARMGADGELSLGGAYVPPYHIYNARCQLTPCLEVTFNYRVFRGIPDPVLSCYGYGDFTDKGANVKLALFRPEDSDYTLPGLAVGLEDFMGTRAFKSNYIVATKVFPEFGAEATIGWGQYRINGFFGGISWMPFLRCGYPYLDSLLFAAEYDATPYKNKKLEPHPKGREQKSHINFGIKYRLWKYFDFSASYIRGKEVAIAASTFYNFGYTKGFIPKIGDPLAYRAPMNRQCIGSLRPEKTMVRELVSAFSCQGFDVLEARLGYEGCVPVKTLRLNVYNEKYRLEDDVRRRIECLLTCLVPVDIVKAVVVLESEGFPIQEYHYCMEYVRDFGDREMGGYELQLLSPRGEVTFPQKCNSSLLFKRSRRLWNYTLIPDFYSFFGSSKGKFKYALGAAAGIDGFLPGDLYYSVKLAYMIFNDIYDLNDVDRLNPSQLINVRTDFVNYLKKGGLSLVECYLQKSWTLGRGFYSRLGGGYFEREYGGAVGELLYYPIDCCFAVGVEGALLGKREVTGLGFTDKIRKLKGFQPSYNHFIGSQYFLNLYYDCPELCLELRAKVGQFLARDLGVRYEVSRYFASGLRVSIWYTITNGNDYINGQRYNDKGVMLSMPLDIFYTTTERKRWRYGMSAWLRDVGQSAFTGGDLYTLINEQRQN